MENFMKNTALLASAFLCIFGGSNAMANLVTLSGSNFDLVYDDSALGQFGAPSLSANGLAIVFNPVNFNISSTNTQGIQFDTSSIVFDLIPKNNQQLASIALSEAGDYLLINQGDPSTAPSAFANGELRITDLSNAATSAVNFGTTSPLTNACTTLTGCIPSQWSATTNITAPNNWGSDTIAVRLQNNLGVSSTENGDFAFIEKKDVSGIVLDINVPVPIQSTVWLFSFVLIGLLGFGKKRAYHT
jgi:hypothetical protein